MSRHAGRVVVVTGGTAGIGESCVHRFAELGAVVYSLARKAPADPLAGVRYLDADVADDAAVEAAIGAVIAEQGRIDVLVNNAGVSYVGNVETGAWSEWHRLFDINVVGYARVMRAALPGLRASAAGSIVNMSSCTADSGLRDRALYSATKGAIESMTRAVAADLVGEGITVNMVTPGTVDTPFMTELAARADDPAERRRQYESRQPTGRMVQPVEVANAVVFLADPENRSMIGSNVTVDGGMAALHITQA